MTDEHGQALVLAVLLLALGAVAIVGLRAAQERILVGARDQRAGEAAVEAAAAVIADTYAAHLEGIRARANEKPPPTADVPGLLASTSTRESARAAAADISARNGATFVGVVDARCSGPAIEVELQWSDRRYRAQLEAAACSQP